MTGKPATKECSQCHYRYPVTHMSSRTVRVNTGNSGVSLSIGLSKNKNPRVHSGRQYYSNKTVWICDDCVEANKITPKDVKEGFVIALVVLCFVAGMSLLVYMANLDEPLFDKPSQEQTTTY